MCVFLCSVTFILACVMDGEENDGGGAASQYVTRAPPTSSSTQRNKYTPHKQAKANKNHASSSVFSVGSCHFSVIFVLRM
jgi:hypothetical protein